MYSYEAQKPSLFTEEAQRLFLGIRDKAQEYLRKTGAFTMNAVLMNFSGDSWEMMACVDRLVELGEIKEIPTDGAAQHRIFIPGK